MQTKQVMNPIDRFLLDYPNKKTRQTYGGALKGYFEILGANPNTYFQENGDYDADILFYAQTIRDKLAPMTYHCYLACIREFLSFNDINIHSRTKKSLKRQQKIKEPLTQDRIPTKEELRNILSYANLRDKAIYLTLLSSGMRVGELAQVKTYDIFMDENPVRIELEAEYTKSKKSRTVFVSKECKRYLVKWLQDREGWLENDIKTGFSKMYGKTLDDDRVFALTETSIRVKWNQLLDKVNLGTRDRRTKVREIHLHTLRKYFRTHLAVVIRPDAVELLLGHKNYLNQSYVRFAKDELAKEYKKGENELTIFESKDKGHDELEKEIARRDEKLAEIEQRTKFLEHLDKKDLAKLISALKGEPLEKVWIELSRRPKKFVKNTIKEKDI